MGDVTTMIEGMGQLLDMYPVIWYALDQKIGAYITAISLLRHRAVMLLTQ